MEDACVNLPPHFARLARSHDSIGYRIMLEDMVSKEFYLLQQDYQLTEGAEISMKHWISELIVKLLEITHGQWIYRNLVVYDNITGLLHTHRMDELQIEIEKQQEIGAEGLLKEDPFLAEVNLEDLETSSGKGKNIGYC